MSLVPENHKTIIERSLEVSRTYLRQGQTVSHSLWVKISPKNLVLKVAVAVPVAAIVLTMLLLIMIITGFTFLAVCLIGAFARGGEKDTGES